MAGAGRRGAAGAGREVELRVAYRDAILAVVDAAAIGEDVDVGTLGAKLAVALVAGSAIARACSH